MEAACRGAYSACGLTIGMLPGESRHRANPYVKIPIVTGRGYARIVAVAKSSQAIIAIDGSYGTLTEIAYALQGGIPVIGLGTWSLSIDGRLDDSIIIAASPEEAVSRAVGMAREQL